MPSFEDAFEAELVAELGDLGPGAAEADTAASSTWRRPPPAAWPFASSLIETSVLPSGIRLVTETMADVRSVAVAYWVGPGSRDEPDELAGASHFLEHLLFKGTPTRSAAAIAEALDEVGGDCNAFTTKEYTTFYVRLLGRAPAARARHPERDHVGSGAAPGRRRRRAHGHPGRDPDARRRAGRPVGRAVQSALFPGHPLGRDTLGTADERAAHSTPTTSAASSTTTTGPATWWSRWPATATTTRVAADLERRFAGSTGGTGPGSVRPPAPRPSGCTWCAARPSRPTSCYGHALGVAASTSGVGRSAVLNHVLGGGLSSRLFQKVREERGLAYSIWSERATYQDAGSLAVVVGTAPEHVDEVLRIVTGELELLADHGITDRELAVAKGNLRAEMLLSGEDSGARMGRIGARLLLHGEVLDDRRGAGPHRGGRPRRGAGGGRGARGGAPHAQRGGALRRRRLRRAPRPVIGRPVGFQPMHKVGVVGAGGRMGREVCRAVRTAPDLELVAAVDPVHGGRRVIEGVDGRGRRGGPRASAGAEVVVDFTRGRRRAGTTSPSTPERASTPWSGTTGLSDADLDAAPRLFDGIDGQRVVAANFAIGAVLLMRFCRAGGAATWTGSRSSSCTTTPSSTRHRGRPCTPRPSLPRPARDAGAGPLPADPTTEHVLPGPGAARAPAGSASTRCACPGWSPTKR